MPSKPTQSSRSGAATSPPDLKADKVLVPGPDGAPVPLEPIIIQHTDSPSWGLLERSGGEVTPIRHRFELAVGTPGTLEHGGAMVRHVYLPDAPAGRRWRDDGPEAVARYVTQAEAAVARLRTEHALPMPPHFSFDPHPIEQETGEGGVLVAHLVVDQFRSTEVRGRGRSGELWWWHLDADENQEHTSMESLVRDVVDTWREQGVPVMAHGSLWWVRSLHVHPLCRGQQLGGKLLAHALWSLVTGPYDLVVLEAMPEPTMFAAASEGPPSEIDWETFEKPPANVVQGLARYFGRMGFMSPAEARRKLRRVQERPIEDKIANMSRELGIFEHGPRKPGDAVPMFAFAGDLQFTTDSPLRLGRRVQSRGQN